ncbi:MAG: diguanylate cyclase, partial [Rikenellaceae bacterium]
LNTVSEVVNRVSIPVSVKMSSHFTNPLLMINKLYQRGAKGVVLFNRLYQPDIDIKTLSFTSAPIFSTSNEVAEALRWIAIASVEVDTIDYAASTGVHSGEDMIKMLLAGACAVQICSTLYENGDGVVADMLSFLEKWLKGRNVIDLKQVIGYMNSKHIEAGTIYERAQFMKYYSNH